MFRSRKLSYSYPSTTGQFNADYADLPLKKLLVNIPVTQTGSGTPSPDNIRPIVGFTEANIVRCGINTWNGDYTPNTWISETSTGATAPHIGTGVTDYIPIVGGTSYYKFDSGSSRASYFDMNKNCIGGGIASGAGVITTPANAYYVRFTVTDGKISSFGLNYPSTATTYEPYNGNTYTFTFGQSICQGSIDWKRGVVVGLWSGKVDMGLLNWGYNSSFQAFYISLPNMYIPTTGQERLQGIANEVYPISTVDAISSMNDKSCLRYNGYLWTKDSDYTDRHNFKNSLIGKYVAYELAEPIEIPLGGIDIKTLQGVNNIFADIGTVETQCIKLGS